jgi:hypothetical protein
VAILIIVHLSNNFSYIYFFKIFQALKHTPRVTCIFRYNLKINDDLSSTFWHYRSPMGCTSAQLNFLQLIFNWLKFPGVNLLYSNTVQYNPLIFHPMLLDYLTILSAPIQWYTYQPLVCTFCYCVFTVYKFTLHIQFYLFLHSNFIFIWIFRYFSPAAFQFYCVFYSAELRLPSYCPFSHFAMLNRAVTFQPVCRDAMIVYSFYWDSYMCMNICS